MAQYAQRAAQARLGFPPYSHVLVNPGRQHGLFIIRLDPGYSALCGLSLFTLPKMQPGHGSQQGAVQQHHRRFLELLDAMKGEYETTLSIAYSSANASAVNSPNPALQQHTEQAIMQELALLQRTVRELEHNVNLKARQTQYEQLIAQMRQFLHDKNITDLPPFLDVDVQGAHSPSVGAVPSVKPPNLDAELTSGLLTDSFGAAGPSTAQATSNPATPNGPNPTQQQQQKKPPQSQGWMALYASQEKHLSLDLGHTVQSDKVICAIAFSNSGQFVAIGTYNRQVIVYDVQSGEKVMTLEDNVQQPTAPSTLQKDIFTRSVAWNHDDTLIASGGEDCYVRMWTVNAESRTSKLKHRLAGHNQDVYSICFTPSCMSLVSASGDGSLRVWEVKTGECKRVITADAFTSVSVSEDLIVAVFSVCSISIIQSHTL